MQSTKAAKKMCTNVTHKYLRSQIRTQHKATSSTENARTTEEEKRRRKKMGTQQILKHNRSIHSAYTRKSYGRTNKSGTLPQAEMFQILRVSDFLFFQHHFIFTVPSSGSYSFTDKNLIIRIFFQFKLFLFDVQSN